MKPYTKTVSNLADAIRSSLDARGTGWPGFYRVGGANGGKGRLDYEPNPCMARQLRSGLQRSRFGLQSASNEYRVQNQRIVRKVLPLIDVAQWRMSPPGELLNVIRASTGEPEPIGMPETGNTL